MFLRVWWGSSNPTLSPPLCSFFTALRAVYHPPSSVPSCVSSSLVSHSFLYPSTNLSPSSPPSSPNLLVCFSPPKFIPLSFLMTPFLVSLSSLSFKQIQREKYILFRMNKTMYGLKEAGKLSNLRLVNLLSSFGFHETSIYPLPFPPCLPSHSIRFRSRRLRCEISQPSPFRLPSLLLNNPLPRKSPSHRFKVFGLLNHPRPTRSHNIGLLPRLCHHPPHPPTTPRCRPCIFSQPVLCTLLWLPRSPVPYWP